MTGEVEDFGNEMDASSLSSRVRRSFLASFNARHRPAKLSHHNPLCLQSHSPAYSFVSNYTFPDCDAPSPDDVHNGLWCAGYGMVFRSGLFASVSHC